MRFRVRTLMKAIAAAAVALALAHHAWATIRIEDDFAAAILFVEGIAVAVLLVIGLAVRAVVRAVRRDDAYALRLLRGDVPDRLPELLPGVESPEPWTAAPPLPSVDQPARAR